MELKGNLQIGFVFWLSVFFSKSALLLSNWSFENVYFKHSLFQRISKILTTLKFLNAGMLASWINWRHLGSVFVWCARHLLYFQGHKSSFISNQLPDCVVLKNKTLFLSIKSSIFLFILCGYLVIDNFFVCN